MAKYLESWKPNNQATTEYLEKISVKPEGWNLDAIMKLRRISAKALARDLSYSDAMVNIWRKSKTIPNFKVPREAVRQLCRALNCDPTHLFGDADQVDQLEFDELLDNLL